MSDNKTDRISRYLIPGISQMPFGELSRECLDSIGAADLLDGIPVPLSSSDGSGIAVKDIVLDMARVIGSDADFVFADRYMDFIRKAAGEGAEPMLTSEGAKAADDLRYEDACRLLRAALMIEHGSQAAMYLYARVCKAYSDSDEEMEEERMGNFKAESMETFELLTMIHPEFAMGYYFLGYAYLNMGLYLKAKLTWEDFIRYSSSAYSDGSGLDENQLEDLRREISGMLQDLEDPVRIEHGCNLVMSGDYKGGKEILDEYREGRYSDWWPLWYYLAAAESSLGSADNAIYCYKRALRLYPANTDAMEELAALYAVTGDEENASKYRKKIEIVRRNASEEDSEENS